MCSKWLNFRFKKQNFRIRQKMITANIKKLKKKRKRTTSFPLTKMLLIYYSIKNVMYLLLSFKKVAIFEI